MTLRVNRSMPASGIIPVLVYADVRAAVTWLCRMFGFTERLRIGEHRSQLELAGCSIVVVSGDAQPEGHSVMIRIGDAQALFERLRDAGVRRVAPPTDFPYGERQFSVVDPGGHVWTFSETIADVDPASWGGEPVQ